MLYCRYSPGFTSFWFCLFLHLETCLITCIYVWMCIYIHIYILLPHAHIYPHTASVTPTLIETHTILIVLFNCSFINFKYFLLHTWYPAVLILMINMLSILVEIQIPKSINNFWAWLSCQVLLVLFYIILKNLILVKALWDK